MKFVVIGSGLMGVTAAYFPRGFGHNVTVIDAAQGAGRGTSFANGSLLTPSMPEPWNAPGRWQVLLSSPGRSDATLQLRPFLEKLELGALRKKHSQQPASVATFFGDDGVIAKYCRSRLWPRYSRHLEVVSQAALIGSGNSGRGASRKTGP